MDGTTATATATATATTTPSAADLDGGCVVGERIDPRDNEERDNDSDSEAEGFVVAVDFSGVTFDQQHPDGPEQPPDLGPAAAAAAAANIEANPLSRSVDDTLAQALADIPAIGSLVRWERSLAFPDAGCDYALPAPSSSSAAEAAAANEGAAASTHPPTPPSLDRLAGLLAGGEYSRILNDGAAQDLLATIEWRGDSNSSADPGHKARPAAVMASVQSAVVRYCCGDVSGEEAGAGVQANQAAHALLGLTRMIETEIVGIAALCLFLQANYTGPALEEDELAKADIDPHPCFRDALSWTGSDKTPKEEAKNLEDGKLTSTKRNTSYQNAVLSELATEGVWPCQVCNFPYSLLLARSIFTCLTEPLTCATDHEANSSRVASESSWTAFRSLSRLLVAAPLWCARSAVAHERLLQAREPTETLWDQARKLYELSLDHFSPHSAGSDRNEDAARVALEYGLAQHHFDRPGMGRKSFVEAQALNGLKVQVTGAAGRRTKYQKFATAQLLVKAESAAATAADTTPAVASETTGASNESTTGPVREQLIEHSEDGILLERIKFEDDKENEVSRLSVLDQTILLALCLDVKNSNPSDGLTAEEMGGYLATVLDHHDDWMVYSTALLERAWLEFERSHARERAILQMQALVDQHTQRLTLTQSTRKSIEESAPVQDRLRMLHYIVYPPRWTMISDLADRYAGLGIVSTAAELFVEVEMWDEVVSCYRRAGKLATAERIVRERLDVAETPRMWSALGDITNDPQYYERAIELSKGRFADAHVSLGAYYFEKGELPSALVQYENAVKIRPRLTNIWFRLGTVAMQLDRWDTALRAFSEVVQQEPEESDAWSNVAAIHMHNKQPHQAYPALIESLKHNRSNWRVWVSKLYTCLDLEKYDEAVQACNMILDLKASTDRIPPLESRCIRAIVGGSIQELKETQGDDAAMESSRRTLSRVYQLLNRISSSSDAEPWVFETMAYFHEQVGQDAEVLDDLMKEYRALQGVAAWEKDEFLIRKMCGVVSHVVELHLREGSRESLTKAKWLARGVVTKVRASRADDSALLPSEVQNLDSLLTSVEDKLKDRST